MSSAATETTTSASETMRLCKPCGVEMAVSNFPAGARRFACKRCTHLRAQKSRKVPTPSERRQRLLWTCAFKGALSIFKQKAIGLSHLQIEQLLIAAGYTNPEDMNVFLLPRNPTLPLTPANAVVANLAARRYLCTSWTKDHDVAAYMRYALFHVLLDVGVAMVCSE